MLNANHPDDERLSALASGDPEAGADAILSAHVSDCDRCTDLVNELGVLRASLAELPDLVPSRPLRLLPEVSPAEPGAVRLGEWVRRLFAPAITASAALAMVGLVGTASPALDRMASSGGADDGRLEADHAASGADRATEESAESVNPPEAPGASADGGDTAAEYRAEGDGDALSGTGEGAAPSGPPAERSPWPMVLFTGVALMIGAALLRWILVPRAG